MKTLLLGDLSPTKGTDPMFQSGDIQTLFSDTAALFDGNDVNFVNLECALTESEKSIKKFGPPLKSGLKTADTLKELGVNYCGLSNNHIFDFGIKGAVDTIEALNEAGIVYTGFGENYEDSRKDLIIEKDGESICIIAVCEHEYSYALDDRMGSRPYDEYDTIADIRKAKAENDRVIVIYHGGKEHCQYPSPRLYKACRAMADNGADVVLCQHSHCIGCYEEYNGSHILYGQGNFHFVKPAGIPTPPTWDSSLAVKYDTKTNEIEFIPFVNYEGKGITIAKGDAKNEVMTAFEERNAELISGEWKKGWHRFCVSMQDKYLEVLKRACNQEYIEVITSDGSVYDVLAQKIDATGIGTDVDPIDMFNAHFGHYLDCEAHTDVWRELFKTWNHTNEK